MSASPKSSLRGAAGLDPRRLGVVELGAAMRVETRRGEPIMTERGFFRHDDDARDAAERGRVKGRC